MPDTDADNIRQENEKRFNEYKAYLLAAGVKEEFIKQLSCEPFEQDAGFRVCFNGEPIEEYYEIGGKQIISPRSPKEEEINKKMIKAGAPSDIREKMQYAGELASGAVELKFPKDMEMSLSEKQKKEISMKIMPFFDAQKQVKEKEVSKAAALKGWTVYPSHEAKYREREAKKAGKELRSINSVEDFNHLIKENPNKKINIVIVPDKKETRNLSKEDVNPYLNPNQKNDNSSVTNVSRRP